jgi:hypothetical protein
VSWVIPTSPGEKSPTKAFTLSCTWERNVSQVQPVDVSTRTTTDELSAVRQSVTAAPMLDVTLDSVLRRLASPPTRPFVAVRKAPPTVLDARERSPAAASAAALRRDDDDAPVEAVDYSVAASSVLSTTATSMELIARLEHIHRMTRELAAVQVQRDYRVEAAATSPIASPPLDHLDRKPSRPPVVVAAAAAERARRFDPPRSLSASPSPSPSPVARRSSLLPSPTVSVTGHFRPPHVAVGAAVSHEPPLGNDVTVGGRQRAHVLGIVESRNGSPMNGAPGWGPLSASLMTSGADADSFLSAPTRSATDGRGDESSPLRDVAATVLSLEARATRVATLMAQRESHLKRHVERVEMSGL